MGCSPQGSFVIGILQARIGVGCHTPIQRFYPTRTEPESLISCALASGFFTTNGPTWEALIGMCQGECNYKVLVSKREMQKGQRPSDAEWGFGWHWCLWRWRKEPPAKKYGWLLRDEKGRKWMLPQRPQRVLSIPACHLYFIFYFFQVSDYLFISVNPNTIHQHDSVHLEGKYFLVKWKIVRMASGRPSF